MKKYMGIGLAALLFFAACREEDLLPESFPSEEGVEIPAWPEGMRKGVVNVLFTDDFTERISTRASSADELTGDAQVDSALLCFGTVRIERLFRPAGKFEARHRAAGLHKWYRVLFNEEIDPREVKEACSGLEQIESVNAEFRLQSVDIPDYTRELLTLPGVDTKASGVFPFDDPKLNMQWHYDVGRLPLPPGLETNGMGLFKAWQVTGGDPRVIVAVLDMGVDDQHEDLAANMWVNTAEIPGNGIDDDNNGYVDDVHGYDFFAGQGEIRPGDHGTHVAGTVAAVNHNGIGVCGVAGGTGYGDGARIMSCALGRSTQEFVSNPGEAIVYAADMGASIIQCSWVVQPMSPLERAIGYFVRTARSDLMEGGLAVFAAGNSNITTPQYPAAYDSTLSVAAVNQLNIRAGYSNYGDWVDISAPGGYGESGEKEYGVLSTLPDDKYGYFSGTSMAAPHVSGVAALIIAAKGGPGFTCVDLRRILLESCMPLSSNEEHPELMGAGILRADIALWHPDDIAPGAVSDLKIVKTEKQEKLEWSVTADPNDGQASKYIVYCRQESPADGGGNQNWEVPVRGKKAGEKVSFVLSGLKKSAKWYLGVVGIDTWGNRSSLSNEVVLQGIADDEVKVYLGPEVLILNWGQDYSGEKQVRLYDSSGRKVLDITLAHVEEGSGEADVSHLAPGRYILKFSAGGKTREFNLIKTGK